MWPSVNGNVLTNQIDIRSENTQVTRYKQALSGAAQKGQCMTSKFHESDKRADGPYVDPTPPPGSLFCCEGLLVFPAIICFMGIL